MRQPGAVSENNDMLHIKGISYRKSTHRHKHTLLCTGFILQTDLDMLRYPNTEASADVPDKGLPWFVARVTH